MLNIKESSQSFLSTLGLPDPVDAMDKVMIAVTWCCIVAAIIFTLYIIRNPIKKILRDIFKRKPKFSSVIVIILLLPLALADVLIYENVEGEVGNGNVFNYEFNYNPIDTHNYNSNNLRRYTKGSINKLGLSHDGCSESDWIVPPPHSISSSLVTFYSLSKLSKISRISGKFVTGMAFRVNLPKEIGGSLLVYDKFPNFIQILDINVEQLILEHHSCMRESIINDEDCTMTGYKIVAPENFTVEDARRTKSKKLIKFMESLPSRKAVFRVSCLGTSKIIGGDDDSSRCSDPSIIVSYSDGVQLQAKFRNKDKLESMFSDTLPEYRSFRESCNSSDCIIGVNPGTEVIKLNQFSPNKRSQMDLITYFEGSEGICGSGITNEIELSTPSQESIRNFTHMFPISDSEIMKMESGKSITWNEATNEGTQLVEDSLVNGVIKKPNGEEEEVEASDDRTRHHKVFRRSFDPTCLIPIVAFFKLTGSGCKTFKKSSGQVSMDQFKKELKLINSKIVKVLKKERNLMGHHISRIQQSNIKSFKSIDRNQKIMSEKFSNGINGLSDDLEKHEIREVITTNYLSASIFFNTEMDRLVNLRNQNNLMRKESDILALKYSNMYISAKKCKLDHECEDLLHYIRSEGNEIIITKYSRINVIISGGVFINIMTPEGRKDGIWGQIIKPKIELYDDCTAMFNSYNCKFCYVQEYSLERRFMKFNSHKVHDFSTKINLTPFRCNSKEIKSKIVLQLGNDCHVITKLGMKSYSGPCLEASVTSHIRTIPFTVGEPQFKPTMNVTLLLGYKDVNNLEKVLVKSEMMLTRNSDIELNRTYLAIQESINNLVALNNVYDSNKTMIIASIISFVVLLGIILYKMVNNDHRLDEMYCELINMQPHSLHKYHFHLNDRNYYLYHCSSEDSPFMIESNNDVVTKSNLKQLIGLDFRGHVILDHREKPHYHKKLLILDGFGLRELTKIELSFLSVGKKLKRNKEQYSMVEATVPSEIDSWIESNKTRMDRGTDVKRGLYPALG